MVDVTAYICEYIRSDEIPEGGVRVVIEDAGMFEEGQFGTQFVIGVLMNGQKRKLNLNKTNTRELSEQFKSVDTKTWIGKEILLSKKSMIVKKKETSVIVVKPTVIEESVT